ncbi:MAG: PIG-L family deacetylase [Clostridiales bacterium]|nr:PIG-L family deacetylase [Clostridiales bacterium]
MARKAVTVFLTLFLSIMVALQHYVASPVFAESASSQPDDSAADNASAAEAPIGGTPRMSKVIGVWDEEAGAYSQEWYPPYDKADLLLFSTHADDEHLFFAGLLPYCVANGIRAQVAYMTHHDDNPVRNGERLDGLWAVGVHNEPVIAPFPDLYAESLAEAKRLYTRQGYTEEDIVGYCVEQIRRFKPQVVVGHDVKGEYGHGVHSLSADSLMQAVALAGDPAFYTTSYEAYGIWDTPKTYLNQWGEKGSVLPIDEPLAYFDGKTAFQVSQDGYACHQSQQWTSFTKWLMGTAAEPVTSSAQIKTNRPGLFGLYRSLVGEDPAEAEAEVEVEVETEAETKTGVAPVFAHITLIKDVLAAEALAEAQAQAQAEAQAAAEAEAQAVAAAEAEAQAAAETATAPDAEAGDPNSGNPVSERIPPSTFVYAAIVMLPVIIAYQVYKRLPK